ncbi:putative gustatory receptor 97a [Drosophila innubila]|uniref:putative gustatory receptor 97a n=1 Tax=Drosophila innubila TaxID=198719 RepID=UPI00148CF159|nr:putative gustatory receptor 97a [Drosophila innubila]
MRFLIAAARRIRKSWRAPRRFRAWSPISKVVLAGYALMLCLNSFIGYFPARFRMKNEKFIFSKPMAVYCIAVATIFGAFYVKHIWEEFTSGKIDQRDAIKIYCYMNACGGLLNYLYQWTMCRQIVDLLNKMSLFRVINYFSVSVMSMIRAMTIVLVKIFGFPLVMQLTLVLYQRQKHPELSWTNTSRTMLPIISVSHLNNCFFCSVVISRAIFNHINKIISEILSEVNRLQTPSQMTLHKPYYRMQRFCDLADRLDELATKYALVNLYCLNHMKVTCFSLVISMGINLFSTTLGCYVQYQAFVDYVMLEKPYDISQALAHFVFLALPFLEIVLLANESQQLLNEAKEAGNLLQRMNLEHADIRFKQEVDAFWLEVCTIQFKLMPLGLLELDGSMVNKMYTTVAGFLLFLIQNDLTVRFSLK